MKTNLVSDKKIEKAIEFLAEKAQESGKNPKPFVFHSLRTGIYLYWQGYSKDIVIAGILHDILEDTEVKAGENEWKFGKKAAKLVKACTFDEKIADKVERYKEMFSRIIKEGKEALIVEAADILDNSNYYHLAKTKARRQYFLEKLRYFLEISSEIEKESVWQELEKTFFDFTG